MNKEELNEMVDKGVSKSLNEANLRETKKVIEAMSYEEQIACAETLADEVIAQVFSLRLVKYGTEIKALKEFAKKI